jgi:hypothetical protein
MKDAKEMHLPIDRLVADKIAKLLRDQERYCDCPTGACLTIRGRHHIAMSDLAHAQMRIRGLEHAMAVKEHALREALFEDRNTDGLTSYLRDLVAEAVEA